MERLAENQLRQGTSSQQYIVTGANELAILLSDLLNNMQMQMSAKGSGKGKGKPGEGEGGGGQGFQLPDIIEKQKSLSEEMKEGMKEGKAGKEGKEGEGEKGKGKGEGKGEGEGDGDGEGDSNGQKGDNGRDGKKGKEGDDDSEDMNGKLFEIYKQQQQLRQQLEDRLSKEGLKGKGGDLLRKMEGIEQQLLDKGFNERTLEKMLNLQYELLKLTRLILSKVKKAKGSLEPTHTIMRISLSCLQKI